MTLLLTNDEGESNSCSTCTRRCLDVMESAYPGSSARASGGDPHGEPSSSAPTRHSEDAVYSFKSMDGVAPFLEVAAIRLTSEIG